jgi:hypothetical protein
LNPQKTKSPTKNTVTTFRRFPESSSFVSAIVNKVKRLTTKFYLTLG